ncbi:MULTISPECIES: hypothetical protein [unclassified Mameliella]|uniref:hypothetical protein n=1 Tax=unclassified Mameliella TaxID=2630630 RepID=UPI00273DF64A|nr:MULTISPECIES: hypothetical protein [unclassified Mameliella]
MSDRTQAQTYPIDCAILLCLSGGWPASEPCARARAEFIRRITPRPVEPPLQIWRCPMGASDRVDDGGNMTERLFDIVFDTGRSLPQSIEAGAPYQQDMRVFASLRGHRAAVPPLLAALTLQLIRNRADIDISGPEFNFVRSIRIFDVRYAWQRESDRSGDCRRRAFVMLGTYGTQGDFSWQPSTVDALPVAHVGLERWGEHCPDIHHRSVFVEWRDYAGHYGFEQVNY